MKILLLALWLASPLLYAQTLFSDNGFHWYGIDSEKKEFVSKDSSKTAPKMQSHYAALMQLRAQAKEALAKAILEPSVDNTADYMRRQKAFVSANQIFIQNWQKALLLYPELDESLNHPTDNSAIALRNDELAKYMHAVIKASSKEFGFILFYRGNSEVSNKFITVLNGFVRAYQIEMIAVSTDFKKNVLLPKTVFVSQDSVEQKMGVKANYEPAIFLVHLKTKKIKPLSYGFMAYEDFKKRLFDVVTNFKRLSNEGIQL
jgi:conjugal transfer pilus assembly protein TraF